MPGGLWDHDDVDDDGSDGDDGDDDVDDKDFWYIRETPRKYQWPYDNIADATWLTAVPFWILHILVIFEGGL